MSSETRVQLRISGRVQGVGFRYSAVGEARRLRLSGWVRNTADGGVELVAEGPEDLLHQLIAWCRSGPPGALVTRVDASWQAASGELIDFAIR